MTFDAYASAWLTQHGRRLRPSSRTAYTWHLRALLLPRWGSVDLEALSTPMLRAGLEDMLAAGYAVGTVRMAFAVASSILAGAVEAGALRRSPAVGAAAHLFRHTPPRDRSMSRDDLRAFLLAARGTPHAALWLVMVRTGLRIGEAIALIWRDVDLEAGRAIVRGTWTQGQFGPPKSGRFRVVDLSPDTVAVLRRRARRGARFVYERPGAGVPWSASTCQRAFRRTAARAGVDGCGYSPHALRHTFARLALEAGASPQYVQQQLGHASVATTLDRYGAFARIPPGRVLRDVDAAVRHGVSASGREGGGLRVVGGRAGTRQR